MNFKRYHVSRNLLNLNRTYSNLFTTNTTKWMNGAATLNNSGTVYAESEIIGDVVKVTSKSPGYGASFLIEALPNTTYTVSFETDKVSSGSWGGISDRDINGTVINSSAIQGKSATFTTNDNCAFLNVCFRFPPADGTVTFSNIMLNTGSTALPYEPYSSEVWHDSPHYIHNTSTDTITTLPVDIYPNDTTVTVGLKGQTLQSSTPSPSSPVMPEGCGERTGNLWDGTEYTKTTLSIAEIWRYAADLNGSVYRVPCKPNTTYTLYLTQDVDITIWRIRDISTNNVPTAQVSDIQIAQSHAENVPSNKSTTFTTSQNAKYILFQSNSSAYASILSCIMLVEGSTPLPYEPYGYKLTISSANTTTPVYLGEVQSTRKIKKLVLTGNENWQNTYGQSLFGVENLMFHAPFIVGITAYSTHFRYNPVQSGLDAAMSNGEFALQKSTTYFNAYFKNTDFTSTDDFKAWLAAQYTNGTPVTVWYVLSSATTGTVNEPLMRIGDYADEVPNISIPVTAGGDTLSVGTTVQPSEVTVNYKGWHSVADVHEKSVNLAPPLAEWVDGYVNQSDGSITPPGGTTKEKTSDYIAIQAGQGYSFSRTGSFPVGGYGAWRGIGWYDSNKAFISRAQGSTQDALSTSAPSNAAYCRICFRTYGETTDTMFNKGLTALPYEPYWT